MSTTCLEARQTRFIGSKAQLGWQRASIFPLTSHEGGCDGVLFTDRLALPGNSAGETSASRNSPRFQLPLCAITMASRLPTPQGYAALAELFACYPSVGIFRLFKDLNAANLLDLQAELVLLKTDLDLLTQDETGLSACKEGDPLTPSVHHLKQSNQQTCPHHERIWHMKLEIRQKLKEYSMSSDPSKPPTLLLLAEDPLIHRRRGPSPFRASEQPSKARQARAADTAEMADQEGSPPRLPRRRRVLHMVERRRR